MKKWISALTAAALLIALIGCSDTPAQTSERKKKKTSVTTELTQPVQSGEITTGQQVTTSEPIDSPEQARLRETLKTADHHYANGDYLDALTSYQEALGIDPASQEAKDGVAKAEFAYRTEVLSSAEKALTGRDYDSAKESLNEGLSHLPGDSELLAKRDSVDERRIQDSIDDANKLAEAGNWDGAQKALEDIIAENPTNKTVNEAYNDLLNRMPITLKNITTISSDRVSVTKDVIKDRYGNIYDGGVCYDAYYDSFGLYSLAEKFTNFKSTAFVSTDTGNEVSFSISIYLDEELVFFKDEITNETAPFEISLNVTGKQTLRIVIKDGNGWNTSKIYFGNSSFEKVPQESASSSTRPRME